ncbi:hypothetical protein BH11ACT7_BH11ACT7_12790 [soil metagenome]
MEIGGRPLARRANGGDENADTDTEGEDTQDSMPRLVRLDECPQLQSAGGQRQYGEHHRSDVKLLGAQGLSPSVSAAGWAQTRRESPGPDSLRRLRDLGQNPQVAVDGA